jgi:hypothetical protein
VYQLTIKVAGGDSYVMANYLPICLSSSARTWLLELPVGSIHSRSQLCWLFTRNFHTTHAHLGAHWDLASVVQKNGESLQEFIQCFCNKRNTIPEVDNKSIIMFFKKGLRDPTLIRKLAMKKLGTSEAIFTISNRYTLAEEVTLDAWEQKKEKDSGHANQPSLSKHHDKKRKPDCSINAVEQL